MNNDSESWVHSKGQEFLESIGMKKNDVVVDFGCKYGNYSIPAAKIVGNNGKIFAVDKNHDYLELLKKKLKVKGISNIETLLSSDETHLPFDDNQIDLFIVNDVLHLIKNRQQFYGEIHRILKNDGILSIFPKHHEEQMIMILKQIKDEIEQSDFLFHKKFIKILLHNDKLEKGFILNFKKNKY